jgi:hypothetical protein
VPFGHIDAIAHHAVEALAQPCHSDHSRVPAYRPHHPSQKAGIIAITPPVSCAGSIDASWFGSHGGFQPEFPDGPPISSSFCLGSEPSAGVHRWFRAVMKAYFKNDDPLEMFAMEIWREGPEKCSP